MSDIVKSFTMSARYRDERGPAVESVTSIAGVEAAFDLAVYYPIFLFIGFCILFASGTLAASYVVNPRKDTAVKLMPYESGMDPIGSPNSLQFDVKFYLMAILFLVFDVELLFLYPWAVVAYSEWGGPVWRAAFGGIVFVEILVFIVTLVVAYVYAWRKGVFQWR